MMRIKTWFIMLMTVLCMVSCARTQDTDPDAFWLTADEAEFLEWNSVRPIEEGKLLDWQKEILEQYRGCMDYLEKTYPEHDFKITTYERVTSDLIKFIVIPDHDEANVFSVTLNCVENSFTDTYGE